MIIPPEENLKAMHLEMDWLSLVISQVICSYLKQDGFENHWLEIPTPELVPNDSLFANLILEWKLNPFERLAVDLALAPSFRPEVLDLLFGINGLTERGFTEFGGMTDKGYGGFLPTGQTLNFLITATDPQWRLEVMNILSPRHRLMAEQVTELLPADSALPVWSGVYKMNDSWVNYLITGEQIRPEKSSCFPAHPLTTPLQWDELVLDYRVMQQVEEIRSWLAYGTTLMDEWNLDQKIKPGFRAVFFGPPGTGKTLTAALLAKSTGREVFRVDLSMMVSKYIGETEKNLAKVFDAASYKDWILFFDEADALFGKRVEAVSSNDLHANQQTGYLLQRIEDFPGTVILATNLKTNMDEAFTRRFQSMIRFTIPGPEERLQLWRNAFQNVCDLSPEINLQQIASEFEVTGGQIINILRQCALLAIRRGERLVQKDELMSSIRQEFFKNNKTVKIS